ncbi:MAG: hypothetical protein M9938_05425 [Solirubrobacterales bacterium]|nr:hypothetical protein [Solirubrobacterales bacterium]
MRQPFKVNYAGAIYGTILSMAVIAGLSVDADLNPVLIAIWSAATAVVFWLAHVYSHYVTSDQVYAPGSTKLLKEAMRRDWPMVQGSLVPAAALLLAPLGLVSDQAASYVAVGAGVLVLFFAGLVVGRREDLSFSKVLLTGSINATIGLAIVALKVFVH